MKYLRFGYLLTLTCGLATASELKHSLQDELSKIVENSAFPDGCGKLFSESDAFVSYLEAALAHMTMQRGANAQGVSDLYAVLQIRSAYVSLTRVKMIESAVDNLIQAQLCQYRKVWASKQKPGASSANLLASNSELHDHLVAISSKLLRDCQSIVKEFVSKERSEKLQRMQLAEKVSRIYEARENGRKKVEEMLEEMKQLETNN